jgi:hypothetical protein
LLLALDLLLLEQAEELELEREARAGLASRAILDSQTRSSAGTGEARDVWMKPEEGRGNFRA